PEQEGSGARFVVMSRRAPDQAQRKAARSLQGMSERPSQLREAGSTGAQLLTPPRVVAQSWHDFELTLPKIRLRGRSRMPAVSRAHPRLRRRPGRGIAGRRWKVHGHAFADAPKRQAAVRELQPERNCE